MCAFIFKEIRESIVWALLILLALGASMAFAIFKTPYDTPLVGDAFHLVTAMGFPAAGSALGLIQGLIDRRRGRWDFVTHRPISRTRIFFAKTIAGAGLYVLISAIPLAAAAKWIEIPGNVAAPFDWHMILPRIADLFSGLVWYVAGLLIAARQARWIGSRLMPVGLAILASVVAFGLAMNLPEAIAIFAAALAILLPAAWGAFVFGGEYGPQPLITRLAQGIAVGTGIAMAVMIVVAMLGGILDATFGGRGHTFSFGTYEVDTNGRVAYNRFTSNDDQVLTDLQGHKLSDSEALKFIHWPTYTATLRLVPHNGTSWLTQAEPLQSKNRYRLDFGLGWAGAGHQAHWYYVVNRRTLEEFDYRGRMYAGSLGPDGFISAPAQPQAFPEPLIGQDWLAQMVMGRTTAYEIDLNDRKISKSFTSSEQDPILDAEKRGFQHSPPCVVVVTRTTVHILRDGRELFHVPLDYGYPPYQTLYISQTSAGQFIFHYANAYWPDSGLSVKDRIVRTDEHGNILERMELPLPPVEIEKQAWWIGPLQIVGTPPAAQTMITPHWVRALPEWIGIGIICAGIVLVLLRRYDLTRWTKIFWIVIAMLMGVSSIFLLLSLAHPHRKSSLPILRQRTARDAGNLPVLSSTLHRTGEAGNRDFRVGVDAAVVCRTIDLHVWHRGRSRMGRAVSRSARRPLRAWERRSHIAARMDATSGWTSDAAWRLPGWRFSISIRGPCSR